MEQVFLHSIKSLGTATFSTKLLLYCKNSKNSRELANNFNELKLNIVDHKIVYLDGRTQIELLDNCTQITSTTWRNNNGAAAEGVGILVDNDRPSSFKMQSFL